MTIAEVIIAKRPLLAMMEAVALILQILLYHEQRLALSTEKAGAGYMQLSNGLL